MNDDNKKVPWDDDPVGSIVGFWEHIYGDPDEPETYIGIFWGKRPPGEKGEVNKGRYKKGDYKDEFFRWPGEAEHAAWHALRLSDQGKNVYCCAHLLVGKWRVKENAASVVCLYADGDGIEVPGRMGPPTLTIESSPARHQYWWRLNRRMVPEEAEDLNRRLTYNIGADEGCWNLARVLRIPGTKNYDYAEVYDEVPIVRVVV